MKIASVFTTMLWVSLLALLGASAQLAVPEGGYPLNDFVLIMTRSLDYKHEPTYMVVLDPKKDIYVSKALVRTGEWEHDLNALFDALHQEHRELHKLPVVDIGANVGAFTFHAASKAAVVHAFEMQRQVFFLLSLSKQLNGYRHLHLHHAALWSESGKEVSFTPFSGNFGATSLVGVSNGQETMLTTRLDEILPFKEVFFMKIDAERSEAWVIKGFEDVFRNRGVHFFVMETRKSQRALVDWFYECGYVCGRYDQKILSKAEMAAIINHLGDRSGDYIDIFCKKSDAGEFQQCSPLQLG